MARAPRGVNEEKTEGPLVKAFALIPGNGGWTLRTYLVARDGGVYEDAAVDTFGAAIGRATRGLAEVAK